MKYLILLLCALVLGCNSKATTNQDVEDFNYEIPKEELDCLVKTLYYEARGEPKDGIIATAMVVLNRAENPRYPGTICKVVKQQLVKGVWQFSFWKEKYLLKKPVNKKTWKYLTRLAKDAIIMHKSGYKLVDEAMYYHTTKVKPSWSTSPKLKFVKKIGNHRFYKRIET